MSAAPIVTELRPSPAKGEDLTRSPKDPTAAERQRRYRDRKKESVPRDVTPPPAATVQAVTPVTVAYRAVTRDVTAGVDVAAYMIALRKDFVVAAF
jgi:hypothetical protein